MPEALPNAGAPEAPPNAGALDPLPNTGAPEALPNGFVLGFPKPVPPLFPFTDSAKAAKPPPDEPNVGALAPPPKVKVAPEPKIGPDELASSVRAGTSDGAVVPDDDLLTSEMGLSGRRSVAISADLAMTLK